MISSRSAESPWARQLTLAEIRGRYLGGCERHLGIDLTAIGPDWIEGRMPATEETRDPHGDNYAGAIAVLAETLASIATNMCIADDRRAFGQSLDVHFFVPVASGPITGHSSPVSIMGSTHIWRIDLRDGANTPVSTASVSMAILGSRTRADIPSSADAPD